MVRRPGGPRLRTKLPTLARHRGCAARGWRRELHAHGVKVAPTWADRAGSRFLGHLLWRDPHREEVYPRTIQIFRGQVRKMVQEGALAILSAVSLVTGSCRCREVRVRTPQWQAG